MRLEVGGPGQLVRRAGAGLLAFGEVGGVVSQAVRVGLPAEQDLIGEVHELGGGEVVDAGEVAPRLVSVAGPIRLTRLATLMLDSFRNLTTSRADVPAGWPRPAVGGGINRFGEMRQGGSLSARIRGRRSTREAGGRVPAPKPLQESRRPLGPEGGFGEAPELGGELGVGQRVLVVAGRKGHLADQHGAVVERHRDPVGDARRGSRPSVPGLRRPWSAPPGRARPGRSAVRA